MTDKEYRHEKKRVKKYIDKWFKTMGLGWYRVDMVWNRARDESNPRTAARTTTQWQYRSATVEWYLPSIADDDDDYLEGIVVHEFTHILLAPLLLVDREDDLPLQHEYATDSVAQVIGWARKAGQND